MLHRLGLAKHDGKRVEDTDTKIPTQIETTAGNTTAPPHASEIKTVKVRSSDDQVFEISLKVAKKLGLTVPAVADDEEFRLIAVGDVVGTVLTKIIEWATHHQNNSIHPQSTSGGRKSPPNVEDWDVKFLDVTKDELFDILLAANHMKIQPLLDLTCREVYRHLKNKTVDEMCLYFDIVDEAQLAEETGGTNAEATNGTAL